MADTVDLLRYIIAYASERGLPPVKTTLVKLLYLGDVEAVRRGQPRLSSVNWIYYKFGPYALELEQAIRDLAGQDVDELEGVSAAGRSYRKYQAEMMDESTSLSPEVKAILNNVLERWAGESLERLLNYAYFETEPMLVAKWREPLDFSVIQPKEPPISLAELVGGQGGREAIGRLQRLRDAFWASQKAERQKFVRPKPAPRYDETFAQGILASDEDQTKASDR
jgi:hypothetical protein